MHSLTSDLRYAIRSLLKSPGFSVVAALTLALGIGANTAIFSVVHGVLLQPLAFDEPERLVSVWELNPDEAGRMHKSRATAGNYFDWREQNTVFDDMALFGAASFNWTGGGEPEQLLGARVSASYFSVLGIEPVLGRAFLAEENELGANRVMVLSYGLWRRRFGGSRDVLGKTLTLDGEPFEVVGVIPDGVYPTRPQATGRMPFGAAYQHMWVPMALSEERKADRASHLYGVLARLKPDVSLEKARVEMDSIARRLEEAYPGANADERILIQPFMDEVVGSVRPALLVLLGAVGLVLLVACANIAGLFLARSSARYREVAVRMALGAGRTAIVRQFLCESVMLSSVGGLIGVGLAVIGVDVLVRLSPRAVPRMTEAGLDLPVLVFALVVSLSTGVLFGLAPSLRLSKVDLQGSLKEAARSTSAMSRLGLRRLLVVAEVAIAVVLIVGAGLLIQSFRRLSQVDTGFRAENVLVADLVLPPSQYNRWQQISSFQTRLVDRLQGLPQVRLSALAYDHPLDSNWIDSFRISGGTETESMAATLRIVSSGYFRTMGIDILRGRSFTELDDPQHPGAVIVNESFVRRFLPEGDALGRRLETSTPSMVWGEPIPSSFEIVGVVRDVKFLGPAAASEPAFYLPARQFPSQWMVLLVQTEGDPTLLTSRIREEVWALDADLPISNITTMETLLTQALAQPRSSTLLLGVFAVAALVLAAMGIYGLVSYSVSLRTNEIGIRMALGAQAKDITRMAVGQGIGLTSLGILIGVASALALGRAVSSLLFGVSATDPTTFAVVACFLLAVAVLASYVPAYRATRIDPIAALRHE